MSACSPAPLESPSKRRRGLVYAGSKDAWLVEPTMVFENGAERRPTVEELKRFRSVARTPIVDDCAEAPADDSTVAPADADTDAFDDAPADAFTDALSDADTVAPADSIDEFFVEVSDDTPTVAVAPADDSTGELIALLMTAAIDDGFLDKYTELHKRIGVSPRHGIADFMVDSLAIVVDRFGQPLADALLDMHVETGSSAPDTDLMKLMSVEKDSSHDERGFGVYYKEVGGLDRDSLRLLAGVAEDICVMNDHAWPSLVQHIEAWRELACVMPDGMQHTLRYCGIVRGNNTVTRRMGQHAAGPAIGGAPVFDAAAFFSTFAAGVHHEARVLMNHNDVLRLSEAHGLTPDECLALLEPLAIWTMQTGTKHGLGGANVAEMLSAWGRISRYQLSDPELLRLRDVIFDGVRGYTLDLAASAVKSLTVRDPKLVALKEAIATRYPDTHTGDVDKWANNAQIKSAGAVARSVTKWGAALTWDICKHAECGVVATDGHYCYMHAPREECRTDRCENKVYARGLCKTCGGEECRTEGCKNKARARGLCQTCGGEECGTEGCKNKARARGLCQTCGGEECRTEGCKNKARARGLCETCGGEECGTEGCKNKARARGLCQTCGGEECGTEGCKNKVYARGLCQTCGAEECGTEGCKNKAYARGVCWTCRKNSGA